MSFYTIFPNQLANWSSYAYFKEIFSKEECEKIIALFKEPEIAKVGNDAGEADETIRSAEVCFRHYDNETNWIYERLNAFVGPVNQTRWGFQLNGFFEGLQITRYKPGGHYDWHADIGPGPQSRRKISLVVQLSNPENYTGCELKFAGFEKDPPINSQGDLIAFPSYYVHKVTPLETGERFSLVVWVSGEPYR